MESNKTKSDYSCDEIKLLFKQCIENKISYKIETIQMGLGRDILE